MKIRETPAHPWKPDDAFRKAAQDIRNLRRYEEIGGEVGERTRKILDLFEPGNSEESFIEKYVKEGASFALWPDANGLRLDIGPDEGSDEHKESGLGIHSHVPYQHLGDAILERVEHSHLLKRGGAAVEEDELLELRLRVASARNDTAVIEKLSREQELSLARDIKNQNLYEQNTDPPHDVTFYMDSAPRLFEASLERGKHVPEMILHEFMPLTLPGRGAREVELAESQGRKLEPKRAQFLQDVPRQRAMALAATLSALNREGHASDEDDEFRLAEDVHPSRWRLMSAARARMRVPRSVYESREAILHSNRRNAEMSKILTVMLEYHDYDSLRALGIETARVKYKKGEFLLFWSDGQYERVLLDPRKHLRSDMAKNGYASIPSMSSADQQSLEGLLLPYVFLVTVRSRLEILLKDINRVRMIDLAEYKHDIGTSIEGMLKILVNEMPPETYESFLHASRGLLAALHAEGVGTEAIERFLAEVDALIAEYGHDFGRRPLASIVDEMLPIPEREEVAFDEAYVRGAPADMQKDIEAFLATLPPGVTPKARIVTPGSSDKIPFAMEGKALRALKIKPAPTLLLVTGAKFQSIDDPAMIESVADDVIAAGKETGANIFMQGTLSGAITAAIARKWLEYEASLHGAEPAFRIASIEPGRSTYVGLPKFTDLKHPYPGLPFDMVLTGFAAGWSPNETMHSYLPHVIGRQNIIQHASIGYPTVTLAINAGGWGAPECAYSARDGFEQFVLEGSGRLADLLGHLKKEYSKWKDGGVPAAWAEIESYMQDHSMPGFTLEALKERHLEPLLESMLATDGRIVRPVSSGSLREALIAKLGSKPQDS